VRSWEDRAYRLRACRELGIEPRFETVDCREEELAGLVWSLNRLRRQLTTSQRAMIANAISMYSERGRPKELPGPATPQEERADINARVVRLAAEDKIRINSHLTQREAARMYGVTTRYVQQAKAVYEADQTLAHKVHQGEITVTAALKAIEERQNPPQIEPSRDHPNRVRCTATT
jgi:hypothetical protein